MTWKMLRFVVINENVLGCFDPDCPNQICILASSVPVYGGNVRPATRDDFTSFRIMTTGYEKDPAYDFPTE